MFPPLDAECLDRWLADPDVFRVEMLEFCFPQTKVVGYYFTFDQDAINIAHASWVSQCHLWQHTLVRPDSDGLSHLKILAILLHQLSTVEWVREIHEFDPASDGLEFAGTEAQREEIRKDINAGRGTYLAFQFVIRVINWHERHRIDKVDDFEPRLTPELEHDCLVYLLSGRGDDLAIYLFLKALYARD